LLNHGRIILKEKEKIGRRIREVEHNKRELSITKARAQDHYETSHGV
jgi:hypothetical protein